MTLNPLLQNLHIHINTHSLGNISYNTPIPLTIICSSFLHSTPPQHRLKTLLQHNNFTCLLQLAGLIYLSTLLSFYEKWRKWNLRFGLVVMSLERKIHQSIYYLVWDLTFSRARWFQLWANMSVNQSHSMFCATVSQIPRKGIKGIQKQNFKYTHIRMLFGGTSELSCLCASGKTVTVWMMAKVFLFWITLPQWEVAKGCPICMGRHKNTQ